MTAGIKANVDGSAAIQVGGSDYITISSAGAVAIPQTLAVAGTTTLTGATTVGSLQVSGAATAASLQVGGVATNLYPLVSATTVPSTSGISISFTGIPSTAKRITVMFNNVGSSNADPLLIRLGSGSTTSTGYVSTGTYGNTSNTFSNVQNTTGFYIAKAQTIDRLYALYTIGLLDAATNTWSCSGSFAGSSATVAIGWTAGGVSLAGTLDRVVITSTGGSATFTAGSINIMWE